MRKTIEQLLFLGLACLLSTTSPAQPNFDDIEVRVLQVRENIYMLVGAGGNVTVQVGDDGVLVVDTQFAEMSEKLLAAISEISSGTIRWIINTHHHGDHIGGNVNIKLAGDTLVGGNMGSVSDVGLGAQIIAHENVLFRMSEPTGNQQPTDSTGWPTSTYFTWKKDLWFNDEGIRVLHQPNAHTDGDSIVYFRQSDVIATGDVFRTDAYPFIDVEAGGTIQGFLDAAQNIVDQIIPVYGQDGGTLVIPGHGRLSDIGDVLNWREMLTVIRDRVRALKEQGMSLEEVLEARPSRGWDVRYGDPERGEPERFLTAVYNTL